MTDQPSIVITEQHAKQASNRGSLATLLAVAAGIVGAIALMVVAFRETILSGSGDNESDFSLNHGGLSNCIDRDDSGLRLCRSISMFGDTYFLNTTSINLRDSGLAGDIPSELGLLTELTDLSLSRNLLEGSIPSELGLLTGLQRLVLFHNNLRSSIPSELGLLTALTGLRLDENNLSSTIPKEVAELPLLTSFNVRRNKLSGSIPDFASAISEKASIKQLYLYENYFTGTMPLNICEATQSSLQECFVDEDKVVLPVNSVDCDCTSCVGPFC